MFITAKEIYDETLQDITIEQNRATARIIMAMLQDMGHHVVYYTTGREGLQAAYSEIFDGILMDEILPDMDGLQLCRKIRESFKEMPIIFISPCANKLTPEIMSEAGVTAFIPMPYSQNLSATIVKYVHTHSLEGDAIKKSRNWMGKLLNNL